MWNWVEGFIRGKYRTGVSSGVMFIVSCFFQCNMMRLIDVCKKSNDVTEMRQILQKIRRLRKVLKFSFLSDPSEKCANNI